MLKGLIVPSHEERQADEPGRLPHWLPVDELLELAAREGPAWSPWPYELLNASVSGIQDRDYISSSMFGGCGRSTVLERREDYIDSFDNLYASTRGTMVHRVLEHAARPNSIAEWRFWTTLTIPGLRETIEISCSPDIVTWDPNGLGDFKTTEHPPQFYPWKNHTRQVQYNQFIVKHAERWADADGDESADIPFMPQDWHPEHVYLVYLAPKGPQTIEVMKTREVPNPKGNMVKRKMPYVWSDEEVLADMVPRVKAMSQALASYPDWPPGLEKQPGFEGPAGWTCPGKPWCSLPNCLAKRYGPLHENGHRGGLTWPSS
jgi:hypothetical protein